MTNANGSAVRRENLRRRVAGRNAGTPNKSGNALVEAILSAAEQIGEDCKGKNGLVGYLTRIAIKEPRMFVKLLLEVMPLQTEPDSTEEPVVFRTAEEVRAEFVRRGIPPQFLPPALREPEYLRRESEKNEEDYRPDAQDGKLRNH
jgi:hypothetical protein